MLWPRTEDPVERSKLRATFLDKLRFLDQKTKAGNTLDEKIKLLSPKDWEALCTVVVATIEMCSTPPSLGRPSLTRIVLWLPVWACISGLILI